MSHELISRNPDLKRLRDEGYEIEIRGAKLIVSSVPYFNSALEVRFGALVTDLELTGNQTQPPSNHVIHFIGDHPCRKTGAEMESIRHAACDQNLGDGIIVNRSFSNKPSEGYADYYHKITRYIDIISAPVMSEFPEITGQTFKVVESHESESVFVYLDTNSSRAEIDGISEKLKHKKIAIVGAGGTGSYILDFLAKTHVSEIHIWDGDVFLQHNAFRAPGAPSIDEIHERPTKASRLAAIYSKMRRGIFAHEEFIRAHEMPSFVGFDVVFICIDDSKVKKSLVETLEQERVCFIDAGLGLEIVDDMLVGLLRVTSGSTDFETSITARARIPFRDADDRDVYATNIQIAELNAFAGALAVIKWKKLVGFYNDACGEHNTIYSLNDNLLHNDDYKP
jgi:hypothetical protein